MQPVETPRIYSGRYELTHLVARGGMALVYRAVDRELDRAVALKVLFPELSVDRAFVERFRREAQAAANLSHPNIVPVFDWGEDDGTYFIVMEFVEGKPLSAVLRDEPPMEPEQIARIGAGVAAALAFAHRHGVVHRDVKPGNILMTPEGDVKVTDFGIARAVNTEESLTQTGAVMGTAAYFSPEQAEGKGVDARSDIYSLGVVLYEMAVGRPPFTGDSPVAVASKHVRDHPVLPRVANPAVPMAFESVVMKALSKNPADRYASAEEMRADLLRFAEGRPVEASDPAATSVMNAVGPFAATEAVMATGQTQLVPLDGFYPGSEDEEKERKRRIRRLVALLVALAIVAFFLVRALGGSTVHVPDVVGLPQAVAVQTLQDDGLHVGHITSQENQKSAGTVLSTDPGAGTSVAKSSTVDLVISAGPHVPIVTVPPVKGQPITQAIQALNAVGLSYTVHNVSSTQAVGTVLDQSPAGGSRVKQTTRVVLTVSGNQTSVSVPPVVGQTPAAAGAILIQAHLNVGGQTSACSNQFNTGLVSAQNPPAGATVPPNTAVSLVISNGHCATVPSVVGQSSGPAQQAISAAGLVANTTFDTACPGGATTGIVDAQNPGAGTQLPTGSTVTISVCQATPTTTTSSTTTTTTSTTGTTGLPTTTLPGA
jgi:serine/threonine-protein kinase